MKKFLKNIAVFGVCLIPVALLPFIAIFFFVDVTATDTMMGELNHKLHYLALQKSPKIVIVGGSGCSHGIDSSKIEKAFGFPVVNMGLHASMGMDYILSSVDPYIAEGDYVVMIPEYPNFSGSYCYGCRELLMVVSDICPSERRKLNERQWLNLLKYMPEYGMNKLKRLAKNCVKYAVTTHKPKTDKDYGRYKYDERGDMIGARGDNRNLGFKPCGVKTAEGLKGVRENDFLNRINLFIAMHHKATVVIFPAALHDISFDNQRQYIDGVEEILHQNGTPYAAHPVRYRMLDSECWDTPYHLNALGIDRRTKLLIEDLKPIIKR